MTWDHLIFDWRKVEENGGRLDHWPDFVRHILPDRYQAGVAGREIIGRGQWREFVTSLPQGPDAAPDAAFEALDWFYKATAQGAGRDRSREKTCVFISHQRADTCRGERVACLIGHLGLNGWLDVHDPTLVAVNLLPPNDPRRSALIAVTIEMALLNSTHVIALHSSHSLASRWVPYEFGRAKSHSIRSRQAAGWFEAGQSIATCGYYVQLAEMWHDEPGVLKWLATVPGAKPGALPAGACGTHKTSTLQ